MKFILLLLCLPLTLAASTSHPIAKDTSGNVTYHGLYFKDVESFIGIRYAHNTGGENRFKPPIRYVPGAGTTIFATTTGPACPQATEFAGQTIISHISEDCLRLNVWRPNGTVAGDKLPVLVWIYGVFGFAQSTALDKEGSENAGIRDQVRIACREYGKEIADRRKRSALEWVQENIASFGGDPEKITVHGQSSGGTAVGFQMMAYGATKPFPFQQAICESQALDLRITGNVTRMAMTSAWAQTSCNTTAFDSAANVECLKELPMDVLLEAQLSTASSAAAQNNGDQWLPVIDGDFLPAAPSSLIYEHKFANVPTIIGWCEDDGMFAMQSTVTTSQHCHEWVHSYVPGLTPEHLEHLLSLYPTSEFHDKYFPNGTLELNAEVYRCGRIYRDLVFTCQPILYGNHLAEAGNEVYYYVQNQTTQTPFFESLGKYGIGVAHTSELPYVWGNLSAFDGDSYQPSESNLRLRDRETRSWSSFVAVGKPSLEGHDTLQGWRSAEMGDENYGTFVIGGPYEGYSGSVGGKEQSRKAVAEEKLMQRCGFLNSPEIVKELRY